MATLIGSGSARIDGTVRSRRRSIRSRDGRRNGNRNSDLRWFVWFGTPFILELGEAIDSLVVPVEEDIARVLEQIDPTLFGIDGVIGGDGFESLIEDNVKLRGDVSGLEVADQSNGGRVLFAEAKKLTGTRTWLPFRDLLPILETGIENVAWAAEDTKTSEVLASGCDPIEDFLRAETVLDIERKIIVDFSSVIESVRPLGGIELVWPVNADVEKHGASHGMDSSDRTFSDASLMVSADTRLRVLLTVIIKLIFKGFRIEDAVVRVILLDGDSALEGLAFEGTLRVDRVRCTKRALMVNENFA